ncbi:hypothetical protein [Rickettsia endosymbiont of Polydrusus tereticollis]|uniref:hypothetical protein n=1 Tax=Rickettsia endosymbiont of Polydrusus tereticollis TaxID=3066251 RepID=UPI003132DBB4
MKKKLKLILVIFAASLLLYTAIWFAILISLSNSINQQYSNRYIDAKIFNNNEPYFIKFSKVRPYGFPFKFAIAIINWSEESSTRKVEFNSPIHMGYDLLAQHLFLSFGGEAIGRHKPVERGFGVKFNNKESILSAKIPLSFQLFKIIWFKISGQKRDLFEIINLIEIFKFRSDKVEIFDLIDNQKLYDEDYTLFSLAFDKSKYYLDKGDFLENIPQKLDIIYSTKISESNLEDRTIPAGLLLYRFAWPHSFTFESKFYIKTKALNFNAKNINDWAKDFEIGIDYAKIISDICEGSTQLLYKGAVDDLGNNNIVLKIDSQIKLKQDFIEKLLNAIKTYNDKQAYLLKLSKLDSANEELVYIINNKDKFDFTPLENRVYEFALDVNLVTELNKVTRAQINNLSLFSGSSGFNFTNESTVNILKKSVSKGVIIFNNYFKIIDILGAYFYNLGKFKAFSDESRELYKDALKSFLRTISDHPDSNSTDISFEYELDLSNLNNTKIGMIDDINKIIPLYYLSLYKSAVEKVEVGDNIKEKMQELIPDFAQHQKILEQFSLPQFQEITQSLWEEIIK